MKRRIKRIEELSGIGKGELYIFIKNEDGTYKDWNKENKEIYQESHIEKLEAVKENHVIIVSWGKATK